MKQLNKYERSYIKQWGLTNYNDNYLRVEPFQNLNAAINCSIENGRFYFSPDTMKGWGSVISNFHEYLYIDKCKGPFEDFVYKTMFIDHKGRSQTIALFSKERSAIQMLNYLSELDREPMEGIANEICYDIQGYEYIDQISDDYFKITLKKYKVEPIEPWNAFDHFGN